MQDTVPTSADILLDAPAVAQMLGMSTFYVRKHLPVVKISPKCLRYKLSDVQAWIAARQSKKG
jgi:predicted DNA-binding transcriptional regulator AlpA